MYFIFFSRAWLGIVGVFWTLHKAGCIKTSNIPLHERTHIVKDSADTSRIILREDYKVENGNRKTNQNGTCRVDAEADEYEIEEEDRDGPYYDQGRCGLFYAPSSIPGAGYGLFAGRNFQEDEWLMPGDLVVPVHNLMWHNGLDGEDPETLWDEYQWSANSFIDMAEEADSMSAYSFGLGSVANCFHGLTNIDDSVASLDTAGVKRTDPGSGGFTPYHGRTAYTLQDIPAGMELFISYGVSYFRTREDTYGVVSTEDDFQQGDKLLKAFKKIKIGSSVQSDGEKRSCSAGDSVFSGEEVKTSLYELLKTIRTTWKSGVLLTLPTDVSLVDELIEKGTSFMYYNRSILSLDFLEENGLCADNIKPRPSTIPNAGRGGFATRFIPRGTVVAPVPLIHISNRSLYTMYKSNDLPLAGNGPPIMRNTSAPIHNQLILNYCFGHEHSTILLCPYGVATGLINHSKERANAKIVWSEKGSRHPEWRDQPIQWFGKVAHSGLAFEYIATRDIQRNEEILIDYGDAWQAAWDNHVMSWQPPTGAEKYMPAYELNKIDNLILRTELEGGYEGDGIGVLLDEEHRRMAGLPHSRAKSHPVKIVDRFLADDGQTLLYTADVYRAKKKTKGPAERLTNLVRQAFTFVDRPHSRDHVKPWSFRHTMMIPDDIMPEAWRNI